MAAKIVERSVVRNRRFCLHCVVLIAASIMFVATCDARLVPRHDPLDGALDSTLIAIVSRQLPGIFRVEEVFLGDIGIGQELQLPNFTLTVDEQWTTHTEQIRSETRVLVFLKPAQIISGRARDSVRFGSWTVAGLGNCYFWTHDPGKLDSLRSMAANAVALRRSWEAALDRPDPRQRVEALWPFLWTYNRSCYERTQNALLMIGPVAGDFISEQLDTMNYTQKDVFLNDLGAYRSPRLHAALVRELERQKERWNALLRRRGGFETWDHVSPPGHMRSEIRRPKDTDADLANDIYGELYQGFIGLGSFDDRQDLPFFRESAQWALKYRFKQVDDACLEAFGKMPDRANLPIIQAVWKEFSRRPLRATNWRRSKS